uniref:Uncharacterized protein n=1 Tax=Rhipicephalus microplus TaxID=6941 RepID=A0A6G5AHW5_RHIMP
MTTVKHCNTPLTIHDMLQRSPVTLFNLSIYMCCQLQDGTASAITTTMCFNKFCVSALKLYAVFLLRGAGSCIPITILNFRANFGSFRMHSSNGLQQELAFHLSLHSNNA